MEMDFQTVLYTFEKNEGVIEKDRWEGEVWICGFVDLCENTS
jgi:hypothetical protein